MPEPLCWITPLLLFFGVFLPLIAIIPSTSWDYNGKPISYVEFWATGGGPIITTTGLIILMFAVGIYRSQQWVKYSIPLGFFLLGVFILFTSYFDSRWESLGPFVWVLISWWFFFKKKSITKYFKANQMQNKMQ